jgi:hypothetical protein
MWRHSGQMMYYLSIGMERRMKWHGQTPSWRALWKGVVEEFARRLHMGESPLTRALRRFHELAPLYTRQARCATRLHRGALRTIAVVALAGLLAIAVSAVVGAYQQYSQVRAAASDGALHLKRLQTLLEPNLKRHSIPDAATIQSAQRELTAAERDFALVRGDLGQGAFAVASGVSMAGGTLGAVTALATTADEACLAGLDLTSAALVIEPHLHADLFSASSSAPAFTANEMARVTADYEDAVRHLTVAVRNAQHADLSALPGGTLTSQQIAEIHQALAAWPRIAPQLEMVDGWLRVAPGLLGLRGPTSLLVELMDQGETRATGGYIGDYGILTIENARMQPFALNDVFTLDTPYIRKTKGSAPPAAYSWWPFRGFGLRDSNLSPDFPTSAQLSLRQLMLEGGPDAQGVVAVTAPVIAKTLEVIGPIEVPEYHETVTAQNMEALVRLYTESAAARASSKHEQFLLLMGRAFMNKLHGLSTAQLVTIAQNMVASLRVKDLQVYLTDPLAEALLSRLGFDGTLAHGPGDALSIVDDDLSGNKSNLFTALAYEDVVALDTQGTATHNLTITYKFDSSTHPELLRYLYGRRVYRTYLRIYTSPDAKLSTLDGFSERLQRFQRINKSDEPGRQMWGGYVYVQDGVFYTLHFTWSTPHVAIRDASGRWHYALTIQRQSGVNEYLDLQLTAPDATTPTLRYSGGLDQDRVFSLSALQE